MGKKERLKEELNKFESRLLKKEYLEKLNIFALKKYLTTRLINELLNNNINIYNVHLYGDDVLSELGLSNYNIIKVMNAIEKAVKNKEFELNLDDLTFFGIDESIIINLKEKGIKFDLLKDISKKDLVFKYMLKQDQADKVIGIYQYITQHMKDHFKSLDASIILYEYLKYYTNDGKQKLSMFTLRQNMNKSYYYPSENFQKDISTLSEKGLTYADSFGIAIKKSTLIQVLANNLEGRNLEIVKERLNGLTFETIGEKYYITYQRVNQIFQSSMDKILVEKIEEDKYREVFEDYNWDKESFIEIFSEETIVYYYLNYKFEKGEKDLIDLLKDARFSRSQKDKYKSISPDLFDEEGQLKLNFDEFIVELAKRYAKDTIRTNEFYAYYHQERIKHPSFNLPNVNMRNFEGRISRNKFIIFSNNRGMRFYDLDKITPIMQVKFNSIILSLEDGYYSTRIFFKEYPDFVDTLGVNDEYELHNLLKRKIIIDAKKMKLVKMPGFLIGYEYTNYFYDDIVKEFSPIEIKKLAKFLNDKYGLNKDMTYSYLFNNYNEDIQDGVVDTEISKLRKKYLKVLKDSLTKEIYTKKEVDNILQHRDMLHDSSKIQKDVFKKAGYTYRGSYIIKNKYSSINGYLRNKSRKSEVLKLSEDLMEIGVIRRGLDRFCKKLKLFKFKNDSYITIGKMNEVGLTNKKIESFISELKEKFIDADYFSINNVFSELNMEAFEDLGFDDEYFEDLISVIDGIKILRINNNKLFKFSEENLTIKKFMDDMINIYSSIAIAELENEISNKYQVEITYDRLKDYLRSTDIFYSDIYDKIYLDKQDFYKEVYGEEY